MKLKIKKNYPDAKLPTRANESDAGLDVYAYSVKIDGELIEGTNLYKKINFIEYDCGISIQPEDRYFAAGRWFKSEKGHFTYLAPRSSISKTNLVQANSYGLIDNGYTGSLLIRYKYIPQPVDFIFIHPDKWPNFGLHIDESRIYKVGDKIGQLIVTEQQIVSIEEVDDLNKTDRGTGGFGSSGNK